LNKLVTIALTFTMAMTVLSCGLGSKERSWQEDVQLSDGRIVQVERRERYRTGGEWGGPGDLQRESTELRVSLAPGKELPVLKIGDGKTSEVPIILDVVDASAQQYFAITILDHQHQARVAGLDIRKPYYEYLLIDGAWKRRAVSDERMGRKANLLISLSLIKDGGPVSIGAKEAADSSPGIDHRFKCVRISSSSAPC